MMQYNYRRGEPGTFSNAFGRQRATGVIPIDEVENINIPVLMIHGDVDQRVGNPRTLVGRGLGRRDVEAAIDLERIGRDDGPAQPRREGHGEA